jgi:hypothetical protein
MKYTIRTILTGLFSLGLLGLLATAQSTSLGDYARSIRKDHKPVATNKVYDNDNLPRNEALSIVGNATDDSSQTQSSDGTQPANTQSSTPGAITPGQPADERQKAYEEWKGKIAGQKSKVDLLSRELDVAQREYRLRAAAFYADAGNRLRNAGAWDKEDAQYKSQIAAKQKALDDAKKQLEDLQEQARKAGVPASMRQ